MQTITTTHDGHPVIEETRGRFFSRHYYGHEKRILIVREMMQSGRNYRKVIGK